MLSSHTRGTSEPGEKETQDLAEPTTLNPTNGAQEEDSNHHHGMKTSREPPSLENIPPELRRRILASIDLRALRSLVRASSTYHAQYRLDRDHLLRKCLELELEGFHVDAYATLMSRVWILGQERTDEVITDFLSSYRRWISGNHNPAAAAAHTSIRSIKPGAVRWLAAFQLSVAMPLADQINQWALGNLKRAVASSSTDGAVDEPCGVSMAGLSVLSDSERVRVLRALYRYETYHHLFGQNQGKRVGDLHHSVITDRFFQIMDPWEAEEIGCVELFVRKRYENLFEKVKADLHPDNPRFDHDRRLYVLEPEGSFDLDILFDRKSILLR